MSSQRLLRLLLIWKFLEKKIKQTKLPNTRKVNLCLKLTSALENHVVLLAFFRVCYIYDFSQNGVYGSENK